MNVKERVLSYMQHQVKKPVHMETILADLQLGGEEINELPAALAQLEREQVLFQNRKGKYGLPRHFKWVEGRISITSKGTGFVIPSVNGKDGQPRVDDIFIAADELNTAMNNDKVLVKITNYPSASHMHKEGTVITVVERANRRIVGTFEQGRSFGFVKPDDTKLNQEIFISEDSAMNASSGMKVVVEVTKWPVQNRNPEGRIVEILGRADEPGVDVLSVMRQYDLTEQFPEKVQKEAGRIEQTVDPDELEGRKDRRDFPVVTIDGEDAKDLDDGVFAKKLDNGNYFLGVYIADVSHYVRSNHPLDREAYKRGTSVYLADRVVPMLPFELSNGICSLNAGTDRLAMCAELEICPDGTVARCEIAPAVIHVYRRLTYNLVNCLLVDENEQLIADNQDLMPLLYSLRQVREILHERRQKRGSVDFDIPEVKAKFDEKGRTVALVKRTHGLGESIVEECMLAANEAVAQYMARQNLPFIYRIHEKPTEEKLNALQQLLATFSQHLNRDEDGEIEPREIQRVLLAIADKPEEKIISSVALRSMQQAKYSPENLGHFGLAAKYYTHFTSPIRRYPDLMVHRLLKEKFLGRLASQEAQASWRSKLPDIAAHCSQQERMATDAERDTLLIKEIEYMSRFVGQDFTAIISGVTAFGIFVELDNCVEGLVHISTMINDYYEYVPDAYSLVGENTNVRYRLGDSVNVTLIRASLADKAIDFVLKDNNPRYVSSELERLHLDDSSLIASPIEFDEHRVKKAKESVKADRKEGGKNKSKRSRKQTAAADKKAKGRVKENSAEYSTKNSRSDKKPKAKFKQSEKRVVQEIKLKKLSKPEPFFFDIYAKKAQELSRQNKDKAQAKKVQQHKPRRKRTTMK